MRAGSDAGALNGYQTAGWSASRSGTTASSPAMSKAASTPSAPGAASAPRRTPVQISVAAFFGWQSRVERPSASSSSQAPGSSKPVR